MQDHTIETLHMQVTHPALPMTHLMILRLAGYMFFGDGLSKLLVFGGG
jgi:hypothetical protein